MVNYAFILPVNKPCFSFSPLNQLFWTLVWKNLPGYRPIIGYNCTIWGSIDRFAPYIEHFSTMILKFEPYSGYLSTSYDYLSQTLWRNFEFPEGKGISFRVFWFPAGFSQFPLAFVNTCWVLWLPIGFSDSLPGIGIPFRDFWFPCDFPHFLTGFLFSWLEM